MLRRNPGVGHWEVGFFTRRKMGPEPGQVTPYVGQRGRVGGTFARDWGKPSGRQRGPQGDAVGSEWGGDTLIAVLYLWACPYAKKTTCQFTDPYQ